MFGEERIHRYEQVMTARGGLLLWLIFLLPLLPDDMVCALAGLSGIAFQRFMVIAVVGRIPAVATGVFTMAGLEGAPAWVWVLASVVGLAALLVGLRYRAALESRLLRGTRRQAHVDRMPASPQPAGSGTAPAEAVAGEEPVSKDPLITVLAVVVVTTTVAVLVAVLTGVSGLASGIVLVWGVAIAVMVSWAREDD
jgi:hypothetical protein